MYIWVQDYQPNNIPILNVYADLKQILQTVLIVVFIIKKHLLYTEIIVIFFIKTTYSGTSKSYVKLSWLLKR
jgi:hypothetical protein